MIKLTHPEIKTLKWSLILGIPLFLLHAIPYWLYSKTGVTAPNIFKYGPYFTIFFIISAEAIATKQWKNLLIYSGAMAVYQVLSFGRYQHYDEPLYREINTIMLFFSVFLVFLFFRNAQLKKGVKFWIIFVGALLIGGLHGAQYSILSHLARLIDSTGEYYSYPIPLAQLFSPFAFWVLTLLYDRLARPGLVQGSLYDVTKPISGQSYFKKVSMLSIGQAILLILIIVFWSYFKKAEGVLSSFVLNFLCACLGVVFFQGLIYILSIRRIIATGISESTIYRFTMPFICLLPARALSGKSENDKYTKQIEVERRLTFCRNCKNRESNLKDGMVCGLTKQKPDFDDQCKDFDYIQPIRKAERKRAPKNLTVGIGIFVFIGLLYTGFLVFTRFFVGRGPDLIEMVVTIVSVIAFWVFFYFIYNQKQWAVFTLMGLMLLDVVYKGFTFRGDFSEYYLIWQYVIFTYILFAGFMPTWRYTGQKPVRLEELIET